MPGINENETMPSPVLPPQGQAFDAADSTRSAGGAGGQGRHEGLPYEESRRAMQRRAAAAPAEGPGGDGLLPPQEQLRQGGGAELPPAYNPGETAAEVRARMYPFPDTHHDSNPGAGP